MKIIRAIRTVGTEPTARYVCIDDFDDYNPKKAHYYCGTVVYEDFNKHVDNNPFLRVSLDNKEMNLDEGKKDGIVRTHKDVFEIPDICMYMTMGRVLREEGFVFNKKLGKIIRRSN